MMHGMCVVVVEFCWGAFSEGSQLVEVDYILGLKTPNPKCCWSPTGETLSANVCMGTKSAERMQSQCKYVSLLLASHFVLTMLLPAKATQR